MTAASVAKPSARRLLAIDAGRGMAMVLVFFSHFGWTVANHHPDVATYMSWVGMVGTPAFMLMSAIMIGLISRQRPESFQRLGRKLIDRSLFLLTAGHLLIALSFVDLGAGDYFAGFRRTFVTDAIAVNIIVLCLLIPRTGGRTRLALGTLGFVFSWILILAPDSPSAPWPLVLDILVGPNPSNWQPPLENSFPLLPWLSFYLIASVVGEWMADFDLSREQARVCGRLVAAGAAMCVTAIALKIAYAVGRPEEMTSAWWAVYYLSEPLTKRPPGFSYLLFFGGAATFLVAGFVWLSGLQWSVRGLDWVAQFGRASLFVFVVQFFIYGQLRFASIESPLALVLVFVASVLFMHWAAVLWCRRDLNRLFTVGISTAVAKPG